MIQENQTESFHAIMDKLKVMEDKLNRHSELLREIKTMREKDGYLDIVETARLFRVEQKTIYNWVCSGKIPAKKLNGRLLFPRLQIEKLIEGE
ncbi:helix-turn-helix domain-containing protein [Hallella mizrahii]|uniref:Helix-turn-helix domain-containing protein n=1 Tax=Hallella mizrahii TaxID=2606637 RepID=A0A7K0KFP8_9BACT|nr:helix-turn-helix domain-containing protein [Hallella mizrahii]MST84766.1 helix-turn-helix domain-containing protein [Hallella mizrahii]